MLGEVEELFVVVCVLVLVVERAGEMGSGLRARCLRARASRCRRRRSPLTPRQKLTLRTTRAASTWMRFAPSAMIGLMGTSALVASEAGAPRKAGGSRCGWWRISSRPRRGTRSSSTRAKRGALDRSPRDAAWRILGAAARLRAPDAGEAAAARAIVGAAERRSIREKRA